MTAQVPERLLYEGEELSLCSEPLQSYFRKSEIKSPFFGECTSNWRGYVGTWEIRDGRLYLVDLDGHLYLEGLDGAVKDGGAANLETIFPGYPDRVFAHWYSGELRVPRGRMLKYVHMAYDSRYEEDFFIRVENGVITGTRTVRNDVHDALENGA